MRQANAVIELLPGGPVYHSVVMTNARRRSSCVTSDTDCLARALTWVSSDTADSPFERLGVWGLAELFASM